jgi:membrane protein required for colicin V production
MNLLDLLLAAIVAGSIIAGFRSGFTKSAFGLIATIAGILLGFWFYDVPATWYSGYFESRLATYALGFLTVFFAVVIAGTLLGHLFSAMFKAVGLKFMDRLAGAVFGLVRGALAATGIVVILLAALTRPVPAWMRGSVLLPYALDVSDLAASFAPPAVKAAVGGSIDEIKKAWKNNTPLATPGPLPPARDQ